MTDVINGVPRFVSVWKELKVTRSYLQPPYPPPLSILTLALVSSCLPRFLVLHWVLFAAINNSAARDVVKTLTKVKAFKDGPYVQSWTRYAPSYDNNSESRPVSLSNDTWHPTRSCGPFESSCSWTKRCFDTCMHGRNVISVFRDETLFFE